MRWISTLATALAFSVGRGVSAAPNADLVEAAVLASADLIKYWQCPVPLRPDEALSRIYLEDENLYAVSDAGVVYAIDADVGLIRWSVPIAEPPSQVFRPCHATPADANEIVPPETYVASTSHLRVFHRRTGKLLGEMKLTFNPAGPPIADSQAIYIGSVNSRFYALKPIREGLTVLAPKKQGRKWFAIIMLPDGKRLYHEADSLAKVREWQRVWVEKLGGLQLERKAPLRLWQIDTEGNVKCQPAVVGRIAYIPSDGGRLFACGLANKRKKWSVTLPGGIFGKPLVGKRSVYVATAARSVYAMDRLDGTRRWKCHIPVPFKRNGYLTARLIYQPGEPAGIYAIDPKSGARKWSFDQASHFLAERGDRVYLFTPGQAIHQVDAKTGQAVTSMPCPAATLCVGNTRDETLYLAADDGRLMCIRPKGVPYLRRAKFERAAGGALRKSPWQKK